ncbi:MAG: LrgB family protein [Alphaproteobacteria bacterium]
MTAIESLAQTFGAHPLVAIGVTVAAYSLGVALQRRLGGHPLANPVLIAIGAVAGWLFLAGRDHASYFADARPLHLLLGPAVVALAIPIHRHRRSIAAAAIPVLGTVAIGATAAIVSTIAIAALAGADPETLRSIAPKSVTAPAAIGLSERLGGLPALTAVVTIATGIMTAVFGPAVLDRAGVTVPAARGLAMGIAGHGIATARMLQLCPEAGAYAGLALGLNALVSSAILPVIVRLAL